MIYRIIRRWGKLKSCWGVRFFWIWSVIFDLVCIVNCFFELVVYVSSIGVRCFVCVIIWVVLKCVVVMVVLFYLIFKFDDYLLVILWWFDWMEEWMSGCGELRLSDCDSFLEVVRKKLDCWKVRYEVEGVDLICEMRS